MPKRKTLPDLPWIKISITMKKTPLILLFVPLFVFQSLIHADWPNWRGPSYNGAAQEQFTYPSSFNPENGVKWVIDLAGSSASTPIILGDKVFLSGTHLPEEKDGVPQLLAMCIDRKTGNFLWSHKAGTGYQPGKLDGTPVQLDSRSNYSSPSPVATDELVVFFYGNGDLVGYKHDGDLLWIRNIQKDYGDFCFQWTFSASPTIHQGRLYLPVLQRDEQVHGRGKLNADSYLLCIELSSGDTLWKHVRETSSRKESREAFSTIIPAGDQLLVAGGDFLTAHDPKDGKELWRWGTWNPGHKQEWWRLVPSPVVGAGRVLVCAPKNAPVYAVSLPSQSMPAELAWDTEGEKSITSDVPTPLFFEDHFYILSDLRKNLTKVSPVDGSVIWKTDLPGKYKWRSSPTGADGKIFIMNHNAEVLVLSSLTGDILNSAKMGGDYDDLTRSSIALSDGQVYIRTNKKLYCIE
jgi:outer membrane protein assembly factor BamB